MFIQIDFNLFNQQTNVDFYFKALKLWSVLITFIIKANGIS
jgi:hypothetical protein